jgi:hypothetical protein
MAHESEARIVGVIGVCSVGNCSRPAVRHVEVLTGRGPIAGIVCERCALATSSALFLLELIA